jgi:hypothetical protein
MARSLVTAAKGVVEDAIEGAKKLLGINSPSKVFAEIGKYSVMGMVNGLSKFSGLVGDAAENVGNKAVDSMSDTISRIYDGFNGNVDMTPTIRPVLDLSDIMAGSGRIGSLLNRSQGITVSTANSRLDSISKAAQLARESIQNGSSNQGSGNPGSTKSTSQPLTLQLVIQNGKAIAEFIVDDLDSLMGSKNKITGRMVGVR